MILASLTLTLEEMQMSSWAPDGLMGRSADHVQARAAKQESQ